MNYTFQGQHQADAALIICMDFRFHWVSTDYVQNTMRLKCDLITMAGSQKSIAEDNDLWRETSKTIKKVCVELHHIKKIVVFAHQDCGAYGGSKNFVNLKEEEQKYWEDLQKAKQNLQQLFPELEIILGYCNIINDKYHFTFKQD
jgi:carbonic anhydrase